MFNKDFFPTPENVIAQMLYGLSLEDKTIYEPSAGKGDIVDYLIKQGANIIATEINPELRKILASKCTLLGDDFLKVKSFQISHINMIVMNPPFSADEKHILHAYDIAPAGCQIIALCNLETVKHARTEERRKLRQIIEEHGEYQDIGDCFVDAERRTNVEIALIKVTKSAQDYDTEFSGFFMDEDPAETQGNSIMPYNVIRDLVQRYIEAVKIYDKQLKTAVELNEMIAPFFSDSVGFQCTKEKYQINHNEFKKDLQKSGWDFIFQKMNMQKYATRGLKEDINKFVEKQQEIPFTMRNIYKMLEIIIGTQASRMDKAILEVFDKLTTHYNDNRYNVEGWKTNSHYLMGEKFILPYMCPVSKWNTNNKIDTNWGNYYEIVEDMVKAVCFITGNNYDNYNSLYHHIRDNNLEYGELFDWGFFTCRAYKKGTMHFKFKSMDVWARFNQQIARIKGYPLPESLKKEKV